MLQFKGYLLTVPLNKTALRADFFKHTFPYQSYF